jgi:hypothetical protein
MAALAPVTAIAPIAIAPIAIAAANLDDIALVRDCRTPKRDGRSRGYGGEQSTGRKGGC